jgi:hypothetical protein
MPPVVVPDYLPSVYGFHFWNSFESSPAVTVGPIATRLFGINDAASGLCGGMALSSRDLYEARVPAPSDTLPPKPRTAQFDSIVRRQVQSLDWFKVPLRYFDLQAFRQDPPTGLFALFGREPARVTAVQREWPKIRAEIASGHPSIVGLIRSAASSPWALQGNHQVVAYGFEETASLLTLRVYDPNHPGDDGVVLRAILSPDTGQPFRDRITLEQSTREPLLGFFRQPYPAPDSIRAWRS